MEESLRKRVVREMMLRSWKIMVETKPEIIDFCAVTDWKGFSIKRN